MLSLLVNRGKKSVADSLGKILICQLLLGIIIAGAVTETGQGKFKGVASQGTFWLAASHSSGMLPLLLLWGAMKHAACLPSSEFHALLLLAVRFPVASL